MRRLLLSCCLILAPVPAAAQEAGPPQAPAAQADAGPPADYRVTIDAAVAEFAVGHHAEARALFRRAHASYPNARTLRGIGMCAFELREYADAVHTLSAAMSEERRALTEEQRLQVQATLTRAEAFVGRFAVTVPEGTALFVDGATSPSELEPDGSLVLGLGPHVVRLRRDGAVIAEERVDVQGGERAQLALAVAAPAVEDTSLPIVPPPPPATYETPTETNAVDVVPAIALLSSGGVVLVAGAVLLGAGLADGSAVTNAAVGTTWSSLRGAYERAPILEGLGGALLGVGAVSAIVGGAWLATSASASPAASRVRIEVGPGSVWLRGVF